MLPILQSILRRKSGPTQTPCTTALILVPTKELANQVSKVVTNLTAHCSRDIQCINLTPQIHDQAQRALLASSPDIVISTPARASLHLNSSTLVLDKLSHLVVDEADLILSYDYEADFRNIIKFLPSGVQIFLASATLNTDVDALKGLLCREPVILDVQDSHEQKDLRQFVVRCAEDEKFLLIFAFLKLKLIKGKCIVFVGDVDRCYRLKLYLEQFGIKSCILNSELPVNCRVHVVEEFNKNVYDIIIASDEHEVVGDEEVAHQKSADSKNPLASNDNVLEPSGATGSKEPEDPKQPQSESKSKKKRKTTKRDREYGVSRGIDFHNVACVLNFDLPTSSKSYTHRIGRTARAGRTGMAISFMIPATEYRKDRHTTFPSTERDEAVLAEITQAQSEKGQEVEPFLFDMKKFDAFRYRVASALKAVSPGAIREARIRELRQELLKSEKLKRHLEENPEDLKYLRHDTELRPARVQPHMRHVPDYLLPGGASGVDAARQLGDPGFVSLSRASDNRIRNARAKNKLKGKKKGASGKRNDPLKSFKSGRK